MVDLSNIPTNLPEPLDDGACAHLVGASMPSLRLASTQGSHVDVGAVSGHRTIIFAYPMTGQPGVALPVGWDDIAGARGCTPQNCAFRDRHGSFRDLGVTVVGLSTQSTAYQTEMAERLHLPYAVLSDADFALTDALGLPTFVAGGMRLIRRLTLVVTKGVIEHVFYPVFPPDKSAEPVLDWLRSNDTPGG